MSDEDELLILGLGVVLTPLLILKFISFCIELYKISKEPKPPTLKQTLNKYVQEKENKRKRKCN